VDGNAADVETITQVIADVEAGFNGKDVDLLTSHLTQDAIATVNVRATTQDGQPKDVGHAMLAVFVLVRERSRWGVAARQDTLVPD
jgi:hypothetical protein